MLTCHSNGVNVGNQDSTPSNGQIGSEELVDLRFKRNTSSPPQNDAEMDISDPALPSEPPAQTDAAAQQGPGVPDFLMSTGKLIRSSITLY
jgi:hypothetical protein